MSSTVILLASLGPIILIIVCTVFFMRRHGKKQRQKKQAHFRAACESKGFQVQYLLQRPDSIAALNIHGREIAWTDSTHPEVLFLPLENAKESTLHVRQANRQVQKMTLRPPYKTTCKETPDLVFYDGLQDSEARLDTAMEESKKWEQAIRPQ